MYYKMRHRRDTMAISRFFTSLPQHLEIEKEIDVVGSASMHQDKTVSSGIKKQQSMQSAYITN